MTQCNHHLKADLRYGDYWSKIGVFKNSKNIFCSW
jgi:hypothetical protein